MADWEISDGARPRGKMAICPVCKAQFVDAIGVYYICIDGTHVDSDKCKRSYNVELAKRQTAMFESDSARNAP